MIPVEWRYDRESGEYVALIADGAELVELDRMPASRMAGGPGTVREAAQVPLDLDGMTDEQVGQVAGLFPRWKPDVEVVVGDLMRWDGTVVEAIQAHRTQPDWEPGDTPALWKVRRSQDPDSPDPWVQPQGAHDAYDLGARVTHQGRVWESAVTANVWEPGTPGTEALWSDVGPAD